MRGKKTSLQRFLPRSEIGRECIIYNVRMAKYLFGPFSQYEQCHPQRKRWPWFSARRQIKSTDEQPSPYRYQGDRWILCEKVRPTPYERQSYRAPGRPNPGEPVVACYLERVDHQDHCQTFGDIIHILQDSIQPPKGGTPTSNEAIERMYEHSRGLIGEGQLHKRSYRWRYDSSMMVYRQNPSIAAPLQ